MTAGVGAATAGEDGNGENMVEDGKGGGDRGDRAVSGGWEFVSSLLTVTAPHVHFSTAVTHKHTSAFTSGMEINHEPATTSLRKPVPTARVLSVRAEWHQDLGRSVSKSTKSTHR